MRAIRLAGIPLLLAASAVLSIWLIVSGSDESDSSNASELQIDGTDVPAVESLTSVEVPEDAQDFLTARLDDDSQLDVTFTIAPEQETTLIAESHLSAPVADERVITHASPLWDLDVEDPIRGSTDSAGDVDRAIELVDEGERVRVRLVITPAA